MVGRWIRSLLFFLMDYNEKVIAPCGFEPQSSGPEPDILDH